MSANLDIMAGDLSKLNEFFYEDPLVLLTTRERELAFKRNCGLHITNHTCTCTLELENYQ